jgi:hypothetical protein
MFRSDRWPRTRDLPLKYNQSIDHLFLRTSTFIEEEEEGKKMNMYFTLAQP